MTAAPPPAGRRRTRLVDRRLQLSLGLALAAACAAVAAVTATAGYRVLKEALEACLYCPHIKADRCGEILGPAFFRVNLAAAAATAAAAAGTAVWHARRLARSMERFLPHLRAWSRSGRPVPVPARPGDPLLPLLDDYNGAMGRLRARAVRARRALLEARRYLAAAEAARNDPAGAAHAARRRLAAAAAALEGDLPS
ncbi:hypothetical protein HCU62_10765 [Dissulfurirhabdus thermomarina]|uniref:hypothetical protein n=1 Tax=Dissulfurirhabdus thermomarina TaxID=1765737 RepID=UPI00146FF4CF|nr:hypothetical protein [Dissulfurirhabdus thermomarina]NMX24404.1 hypothetical protein [Dissulfurirhabdus thermomarina]